MLKTIIDWTVERARKGVEFEVEGALVRGAAEYVPHACASAIGCALAKAQIGMAVSGVVIVCIIVIVRHNRKGMQNVKATQSSQSDDAGV